LTEIGWESHSLSENRPTIYPGQRLAVTGDPRGSQFHLLLAPLSSYLGQRNRRS